MDWIKEKTNWYKASKIYQNLSTDRNEIRLLTLKAGSGKTPIECDLATVSLYDPRRPSFDALSYTWGSIANPRKILVNGKQLLVTVNLHVALEHFRTPHGDLCLWIDAICVNQFDCIERGEQVLLMRDIYSQAENTMIWLGPEHDRSEQAMDLIDLFAYVYETSHIWAEASGSRPDPNMWGPRDSWKIEDDLEALTQLLQRPWFFRIWVVQEAAMSRNPIVCCGNRRTTWRCIRNSCSFFSMMKIHFASFVCDGLFRIVAIDDILIAYKYTSRHGLEQRKDLLSLLSEHRGAQATDPRDKCIALLGLSGQDYKAYTDSFKVNLYSMSVCEIYTVSMRWIALKTHEMPLIFMLYSGYLRGRRDLPSWVPNWSVDKFLGYTIAWWQIELRGPTALPFVAYSPIRGLALGTRKLFKFPDNSKLIAAGVIFDSIYGYTEDFFGISEDTAFGQYSDLRVPEGGGAKSQVPRTSGYPTGELIPDVLCRTLVMDRDYYGCLITDDRWKWVIYWIFREGSKVDQNRQYPENYRNRDDAANYPFYSILWKVCHSFQFAGTTFKEAIQEQILRLPDGFVPLDTEQQNLAGILSNAVGGRRLAVSKKGYIGFIPMEAEKDDIIVILFGCPVPVILRKHDGWYELVGTCYIHGIMEGELVPGIQNGEYKIQDLEMR